MSPSRPAFVAQLVCRPVDRTPISIGRTPFLNSGIANVHEVFMQMPPLIDAMMRPSKIVFSINSGHTDVAYVVSIWQKKFPIKQNGRGPSYIMLTFQRKIYEVNFVASNRGFCC